VAVLGLDLGTSGAKALVLAEDGHVAAVASSPCTVDRPQEGWAEADPQSWITCRAHCRPARPRRRGDEPVRAIGLAGQMHGVVLCDSAGRPVRPALLWPDRRAVGVLPRWRALPAGRRAAIANPLVPGWPGRCSPGSPRRSRMSSPARVGAPAEGLASAVAHRRGGHRADRRLRDPPVGCAGGRLGDRRRGGGRRGPGPAGARRGQRRGRGSAQRRGGRGARCARGHPGPRGRRGHRGRARRRRRAPRGAQDPERRDRGCRSSRSSTARQPPPSPRRTGSARRRAAGTRWRPSRTRDWPSGGPARPSGSTG
jgi:hypothetical protein